MLSPTAFLWLVGALCFLIVEGVLMLLKWIGVLGLGWGWTLLIALLIALFYVLLVNEFFNLSE